MRPLGVQVYALAYRSGVPWNETAFNNEEFEARRYDEQLQKWTKAQVTNQYSLSALNVGQAAIIEMEGYCRHTLNVKRIWLDVFEDNEVGIHIYEKMGYTRFKQQRLDGRQLYFYEKPL